MVVNVGRHVRLRDVAEVLMGQSPLGETVSSVGDVPLLNGPTEFGSHHPWPVQFTSDARKLAQPGDILFCVRGSSTGRMNWADREYAIGRGLAAIRHHEDTSLQSLVRGVIELALPNLLAQATGSTFPNLSSQQIAAIPFPAISLEEQRAIAHVLGTLDDKIELNRRMCETLEAMARAFFQSWFVDFEPVRAKMEGRWRPGESLPGLPAEHYHLFPDTLVPSPLGDIPEGWEVRTLGDVVEVNPREPLERGSVSPYLDMAALPTSGPNADDAIWREFTSGSRFRNGDTLLARITPCLENGKTAYVQHLPEETVGWGSTEFVVMRAKPPIPSAFAYLLARDEMFREHAIQSMTGTSGRQRVQVDSIASYVLPCPTTGVWAAFGLLTKRLFSRISSSKEEASALVAQRDSLLPRLVSGEVSLPKAGNDNAQ